MHIILPFKNEQGQKLCIQWGHDVAEPNSGGGKVTFDKRFASLDSYCFFPQPCARTATANNTGIWTKVINKCAESVNVVVGYNTTFTEYGFDWLAIGFIE